MKTMKTYITMLLLLGTLIGAEAGESPKITYDDNTDKGTLSVAIDGKKAFVYQYGANLDMAHYYPILSPSGKTMTIQKSQPWPHHRSFWFADKVRLAGQRAVAFYMSLYTGKKKAPPYNDRIRHVKFLSAPVAGKKPAIHSKLVWEMDKDRSVLDEDRVVRITALGNGEYFMDVTFKLTAAYGDVTFVSDSVHYAWPYVRMHPDFSVKSGGTIISSEGKKNQAETNGKVATWMDYSNTIDGTTEGLAIFSHPSNGHPHKWLTRDYGTFGPRRVDAKSGKRFTLKKGDSIKQRVGILVHKGDVAKGKVESRYKQYISDQPLSD